MDDDGGMAGQGTPLRGWHPARAYGLGGSAEALGGGQAGEGLAALRRASGRPAILSKTAIGAISGFTIACTGMMKVCSRAYWPDRTACGTESVKHIQVDIGGKSILVLG